MCPGLSGPLERLRVHSSDQAGEEPQVTLNKESHSNGFGFELHFATRKPSGRFQVWNRAGSISPWHLFGMAPGEEGTPPSRFSRPPETRERGVPSFPGSRKCFSRG